MTATYTKLINWLNAITPNDCTVIVSNPSAPQPRELIIGWKDTDETYTEALTAIRVVNDTFYAVTIESMLEADGLYP